MVTYIRHILLNTPPPRAAMLLSELGKIWRNLTQVAKWVNAKRNQANSFELNLLGLSE